MTTKTITYLDRELTVDFEYTPAETMVWTYSNGDPGHPGFPAETNIYDVYMDGRKITAWLSEHDFMNIKNIIENGQLF